MPKQTSKPGTCYVCYEEITKRTVKSHLIKKHKSESGDNYFIIKVDTRYSSPYWMIFLIKQDAMLSDLDNSLRDIWVECCGHLSSFHINGQEYSTSYDGEKGFEDTLSMKIKINKVLGIGYIFEYEYDFGSTTELRLEVIDIIKWAGDKKVIMVAMNNKPEFLCTKCSKPATYHYTETDYSDVLCKSCASDEEIDEYCLLPICNSPRTGVCGYEGGRYDSDPNYEEDE